MNDLLTVAGLVLLTTGAGAIGGPGWAMLTLGVLLLADATVSAFQKPRG
jgi:hypothetical protein